MKQNKTRLLGKITSFVLLLAMVVGMASSLGKTANAASIKVTYNLCGGWISPTDSSTSFSRTYSTTTFNVDSGKYYYPGKVMMGWATSQSRANSGTIDYTLGKSASLSNGTNLYAVWGTIYSFFNSDGTRKISETTVPCGKTIGSYFPSGISHVSNEEIVGVKINGDVVTAATINKATAPTTLYLRKIKKTVRHFKTTSVSSAAQVQWVYISLTDAQFNKLCNMKWPLANDYRTFDKFQWRNKPSANASNCHEGWDIGGDLNNSIYAAYAGKVSYVDNNAGGSNSAAGKYVEIDHGDNIVTRYLHLNSISLSSTFVNTYSEKTIPTNSRLSVSKGQVIAKCGSTGTASTSAHLHFGVTVNNKRVDVEQFMWLSYERDLKSQGKTVTVPSEKHKTYEAWRSSTIIK
ncbi:MAG: M23 family metallopeptidase [Lachnospiraceae bacterium]|nr:M23 family metallopeptidase [Lachnospiraceae bacterium]